MKPTLQLVTPQFVEEYFKHRPRMFDRTDQRECDRVAKRIECRECGYSTNEAYYWLIEGYPGIAHGPNGSVIPDPGCSKK